MSLGQIKPERKTGQERISFSAKESGVKLLEFWQWSTSDLLSNATRGRLAEFLVATDLGVADGVRNEWDAYDLGTKEGVKVEVKSSAYLQSWHQDKWSAISFDIKPTLEWDYHTNKFGTKVKRHSDVYVFCLLHHKDKATIDPLNLDQWVFYVLPTKKLDSEVPSQKRISLSSLRKLEPVVCRHGKIDVTINSLYD